MADRTVTLTDAHQDLLANALGMFYAYAPLRREEIIALADDTGLMVEGDDDGDDD